MFLKKMPYYKKNTYTASCSGYVLQAFPEVNELKLFLKIAIKERNLEIVLLKLIKICLDTSKMLDNINMDLVSTAFVTQGQAVAFCYGEFTWHVHYNNKIRKDRGP